MTPAAPQCFFIESCDGFFEGTDAARGPWSTHACHAGPVAALIARAIEQQVQGKSLTRLTVDLLRPAPIGGLRVEATLRRNGRSLANASAALYDRDGNLCATATSAHIVHQSLGDVPSHVIDSPKLSEAAPGRFPVTERAHDLPAFGDAVQTRFPPGEIGNPGPTTMWMKSPPLLRYETPSPFQQLCPLADCGNGLSRNAEVSEMTFVNVDLTVTMYRDPVSDWLASSSVSHWQANGTGLATATLFDQHGSVGSALQTLILGRS